jgi:hypothetical protein
MFRRQFYFPRFLAHLATKTVDDPAVSNRDKPWPKRTDRIVGMTDRVNSEKHILNRIFHIDGLSETSRGN